MPAREFWREGFHELAESARPYTSASDSPKVFRLMAAHLAKTHPQVSKLSQRKREDFAEAFAELTTAAHQTIDEHTDLQLAIAKKGELAKKMSPGRKFNASMSIQTLQELLVEAKCPDKLPYFNRHFGNLIAALREHFAAHP